MGRTFIQHLNTEYAELCRKLPSPLLRDRPVSRRKCAARGSNGTGSATTKTCETRSQRQLCGVAMDRQWEGQPTGLLCPRRECAGRQVWRWSWDFEVWFRGCSNYPECNTARDYHNNRFPEFRHLDYVRVRHRSGCLLSLPLLALVLILDVARQRRWQRSLGLHR
jgi:hypothetical protein